MKENKPTWKDVKTILGDKSSTEILKLVVDLYSLNAENKTFIHSRYGIGVDLLAPYKQTISEALYPDVCRDQPIRLSVGKKAISDYFKSTKDTAGQLELMFHYLEMGNKLTLDFGDIDEKFYASLESMFDRILLTIDKQSSDIRVEYLTRLANIVESVRDMGWGYHDYLSEMLEDYHNKNNVE